MPETKPANVPLVNGRDTAPAFWMNNTLWLLLIEGSQTGGSYSLLEQWMRKDTPVPPHVHNFNDEWFYVIEGTLELTIGGEPTRGTPGDNIWIPRGTVHEFTVTSDVCHVLNGYTPGGVEQSIKHLAQPTDVRELPPASLPLPDERTKRLIFNNYWTCEAGAGWEQTDADPRA